jgi:E3 ubiquitin-protein ligase HECTD1
VQIESSDYVEPATTVDLTPIQTKLDAISAKIDNLQSSGGGASSTPTSTNKTLTYASDGDTNGVFYYLGTNKGTEAWSNPSTKVTLSASSILSGRGVERLVDRSAEELTGDAHTNRENNAWFKVDFGSNRLQIKYYTLQARKTIDQQPRSWLFQGSNDDVTYTDIDIQNNNATLSNGSFYRKQITGQTSGYRYYKLTQTDTNSSGDTYFTLGEWEFYGTLTVA